MRHNEIDTYIADMRGLRDAMIARTEAQIAAFTKSHASLMHWISDMARQGETMLAALDAGDPAHMWARTVADFNRVTRPHRKKQVQHAKALAASLAANIADLRRLVAGLRAATDPVLDLPVHVVREADDVERIAAMLATRSEGDTPPTRMQRIAAKVAALKARIARRASEPEAKAA